MSSDDVARRSPQGERGLKSCHRRPPHRQPRSLSARRAWIEISTKRKCRASKASLSARRAWIEIDGVKTLGFLAGSLSARRAWIEITSDERRLYSCWKSLSARRAWIEMLYRASVPGFAGGRSPQGERGLKLMNITKEYMTYGVALRKESVD